MSDAENSIDLVRWSFNAEPDKVVEIREYLEEEGLDVTITDDTCFSVLWDEAPRDEIEEVIDEIWAINGTPCELTHEEFHRQTIQSYTSEDDVAADAA